MGINMILLSYAQDRGGYFQWKVDCDGNGCLSSGAPFSVPCNITPPVGGISSTTPKSSSKWNELFPGVGVRPPPSSSSSCGPCGTSTTTDAVSEFDPDAAWKSPKSSAKESANPSSSEADEKVKDDETLPGASSRAIFESENGPQAPSSYISWLLVAGNIYRMVKSYLIVEGIMTNGD